jgi:chaperonin GroEL
MSKKQLLFRSAAREKILRGATALADAVKVTLGPKSKSVLIGKKWGSKVVRIALENAVSVASVLLLTEVTLTDAPEPETKAEAPHAFE